MKEKKLCATNFWVAASLTAAFVSGCGGGGNSPTLPAPEPVVVTNFPVDSVVTKLATNGGSFTGKYTDSSGNQSTMSVVYVPGAGGTVIRRQTITPNAGVATSSQFILGFVHPSTLFQVIGWTSNTGDKAVISQSKPLPASADIGAGANLFKGSLLIQNNGINTVDVGLTHFLSYDWTLAAASNTSADLCLGLEERADFITNTTVDCFRIDAAGSISAFKSILKVQAKSIDSQTVYQ